MERVTKQIHDSSGRGLESMEKDRLQMTTVESEPGKKNSRRQRGFTLIEVLIGLVFLSLGLLAMAGLQLTAVLGNFNSKNLTQATYALQDRLEVLESVPFDSLSGFWGTQRRIRDDFRGGVQPELRCCCEWQS